MKIERFTTDQRVRADQILTLAADASRRYADAAAAITGKRDEYADATAAEDALAAAHATYATRSASWPAHVARSIVDGVRPKPRSFDAPHRTKAAEHFDIDALLDMAADTVDVRMAAAKALEAYGPKTAACHACGGRGIVAGPDDVDDYGRPVSTSIPCPTCAGFGV